MSIKNLKTMERDLKELKMEWSKKSPNLKKCGEMLEKLKREMTEIPFLPISASENISKSALLVARSILEIGVQYSIATKNLAAFKRYMSQLKCYYYDYSKHMNESSNMYQLIGAYLLFLLCTNRLSEFHTELERLAPDIIVSNIYIKPILALQQCFMEGRYNKIFQMKSSVPSDLYHYFIEIMLHTVRDEIGECMEKSYERISFKNACKRLNFKSNDDMKSFYNKRGWILGLDGYFDFIALRKSKDKFGTMPTKELTESVLNYAYELETIV